MPALKRRILRLLRLVPAEDGVSFRIKLLCQGEFEFFCHGTRSDWVIAFVERWHEADAEILDEGAFRIPSLGTLEYTLLRVYSSKYYSSELSQMKFVESMVFSHLFSRGIFERYLFGALCKNTHIWEAIFLNGFFT